jgi:excinuclease UvrABC helicase subunit UvrB
VLESVLESVRRARAADSGRTLVLTVTKRDAEDMAEWLAAQGVRVAYLHSGLKTPRRSAVLRRLREGQLEAVVGISLLRERLDLPEVRQVLVLDCDREGFLRSAASLAQMCGRAARNAHGRVAWYADRVTNAMQQCLDMTERRREVQLRYQREHGVRPSRVRNNQAGATPFDEQAARAAAEKKHGAAWQARARAQAMARGEEADEGPGEQEQEQQDHLGAVDGIDWEAALKLADAERRAGRPCTSSSGSFSLSGGSSSLGSSSLSSSSSSSLSSSSRSRSSSSSSSSSSSGSMAGASDAELGKPGVAADHVFEQPGHIKLLRSTARELERRTGVYL